MLPCHAIGKKKNNLVGEGRQVGVANWNVFIANLTLLQNLAFFSGCKLATLVVQLPCTCPYLRLPGQLLEEVVRLELLPLLLVGQHPRYLEVHPGHLVAVVVAVVAVVAVAVVVVVPVVGVVRVRVVHGRGRRRRAPGVLLEGGGGVLHVPVVRVLVVVVVVVPDGGRGGEHAAERVHGRRGGGGGGGEEETNEWKEGGGPLRGGLFTRPKFGRQ